MFDMNDAAPQMGPMGELIPDGTFAKIKMTIRPGGVNGAAPLDAGLLTQSKTSDAKMLDCEFTVMDGPYIRKKFWRNFVVDGGKRNEKGESIGWNISKSFFRAMIESTTGLDPKDMSPEAKQKRTLQGLKHLDGIVFVGRIMIEPASNPQYKDKNDLANVVLANEPQYVPVMNGQQVDPDPVNAKPRNAPAAAGAGQAPGWQTQQQPAATAQPATPPAAAADAPAWLTG
jgi:hypothetical protein